MRALINPGLDAPRSDYILLGMPKVYLWGFFWFLVQIGVVISAYLQLWRRGEDQLSRIFDITARGVIGDASVFCLVSLLTIKLDPGKVAAAAEDYGPPLTRFSYEPRCNSHTPE